MTAESLGQHDLYFGVVRGQDGEHVRHQSSSLPPIIMAFPLPIGVRINRRWPGNG